VAIKGAFELRQWCARRHQQRDVVEAQRPWWGSLGALRRRHGHAIGAQAHDQLGQIARLALTQLGHGQLVDRAADDHHGRPLTEVGTERSQAVEARLHPLLAFRDDLGEHLVDPRQQLRNGAEVLVETDDIGPEATPRPIPQRDVGSPKAVDRLLRVADDEELARCQLGLGPRRGRRGRVGRGQQERDVELDRVGVLELVDEDDVDARRQAGANAGVGAKQVPCVHEQVMELETPS
jgi:hypothetical protein